MIDDLVSTGRDPLAPDQLDTFGRFVGQWMVANWSRSSAEGEWVESEFRWSFAWVLGGRAIQDVIQFRDETRAGWAPPVGTTLRQWMPQHEFWQVTWWCPPAMEHVVLTGGPEGDRIVLRGVQADGRSVRWAFSEVRDESFVWDGECSDDGGSTWWHEQHMDARRGSA